MKPEENIEREGESSPLAPGNLLGVAIGVGVASMACSLALSWVAVTQSRRLVEAQTHQNHLQVSRLIAAAATASPAANQQEVLGRLKRLWQESPSRHASAFLCVIGPEARLTLNTKRPQKVGTYVGKVALEPRRNVHDLLRERSDWVGENVNHAGERQIAAYAYVPEINSLVATHVLRHDVDAEIWAAFRPPIIALLVVSGLLVPGGLGFLYASYHRAARRHQVASQRLRQVESEMVHAARLSTAGEMAAGIVHELSQPLYAIANFADATRNALAGGAPAASEQAQQWCGDIVQQVQRSSEIIDRLRAFARLSVGEDDIDFGEIADQGLELIGYDARRAGVSFAHQVDPELPLVRGDAMQLQLVFLNVVRNAVEASRELEPAQRTVTINTGVDEHNVYWKVADHGGGIAEEDRDRVFDTFFTTKTDGMGIGLALSKRIIDRHQGAIDIGTAAGGGAVVTVRVPRRRAAR